MAAPMPRVPPVTNATRGMMSSLYLLSSDPSRVPGIHVLFCSQLKDVDGRDKPGHDVNQALPSAL